jgi:hypothetical protein
MQNAANREKCYTARDAFFQCVAQKGLMECKAEDTTYNGACPKSWRDFFDRQQERQMVLEGQAEVARMKRAQQQPK